MTDVAIIGGGAAGLALSVMLKRDTPDISVTVFEAAERVGRKLSVTGNGRCNITNTELSARHYHGDTDFAAALLENFGFDRQEAFFKTLGVDFTVSEEGRVYPRSLQAASVTDALRFKAEEIGVVLKTGCRIERIERVNGAFAPLPDKKELFRTVAVATGGSAGGKLGNDSGYAILKSFGHKIEKVFPSVVQLKTSPETVRQLKGIKTDATVTAESSLGRRSEFGEVLFCDYGLSGPPVLQVSRLCNGEKPVISLDIMPDKSKEELFRELVERKKLLKNRVVSEFFTGMLHKRLGQVILKSAGADMSGTVGALSDKILATAADIIKSWKFKVTGTAGLENAQVTAGGAQAAQFFENCMSKKVKGLFAVGEVLDVDGDCGGYNLAFAWSSAYAAANGIKEYLKNADNT